MSRDATETKINKDGLRYKSKVNGSPFGQVGSTGSSMSCIKCGQHKPRAMGSFKKMLGQHMFICGDCKPTSPLSKLQEETNDT